MKKLPKKKLPQAAKRLKKKYNRGSLSAGMAYALLILFVVVAGGSLMVGNLTPKKTAPVTNQPVVITTKAPEITKTNLQFETFPGSTATPTPTPTPTPSPTSPPSSGGSGGRNDNEGGNRGGGGNSSPNGGSGGNNGNNGNSGGSAGGVG